VADWWWWRQRVGGAPGSLAKARAIPGRFRSPRHRSTTTGELSANPPAPDGAWRSPDWLGAERYVGDRTGSDNVAYRLAVEPRGRQRGDDHRVSRPRDAAMWTQLAKWSHDLLGETRLLESSAPSDDRR
jgi:hypothetical protein